MTATYKKSPMLEKVSFVVLYEDYEYETDIVILASQHLMVLMKI